MDPIQLNVTDDSGFLALVDPDAYKGYIGRDWTLEGLVSIFEDQTVRGHLAFWGTGREDIWRVEVRFSPYSGLVFHEFETKIVSSKGRLYVTNYESLTMIASYEDERLPSNSGREEVLQVEPGTYRCRVVQRFDPEPWDPQLSDEAADFVIELSYLGASTESPNNSRTLPWANL